MARSTDPAKPREVQALKPGFPREEAGDHSAWNKASPGPLTAWGHLCL